MRPIDYFLRGMSRIIAPFQRDHEIETILNTSDEDTLANDWQAVMDDIDSIVLVKRPNRASPPDNWYK